MLDELWARNSVIKNSTPFRFILEPSSFRTLVPFGPGIGQGVQIDYKGYLRVRGGSNAESDLGKSEVRSQFLSQVTQKCFRFEELRDGLSHGQLS